MIKLTYYLSIGYQKIDLLKKEGGEPSFFTCEIVCKPSSVFDGHLSRTCISARFKRCGGRAGYAFALNLASGGVYIAHCRQIAGELLPRLSILAVFQAVFFCCTVLEVAFTGSYPAPLPCDARTFLNISCDRLANSHRN